MDWEVHGTKNGGLPVKVEKRGQKVVTIVQNVTKAPEVLVFGLKRSLGTGGHVTSPGIIEIQGNKKALVEAHLLDCPHQLKGVAGLRDVKAKAKAAARAGPAVVDAPRPGGDTERRRDKPRWDRRDKESERKYAASSCGCSWVYCTGCKGVVLAAEAPATEAVFGELDDPWAGRARDGSTTAVVTMDDKSLTEALRTLGMLSESLPTSPLTRRKHQGSRPAAAASPTRAAAASRVSAAPSTASHRSRAAVHERADRGSQWKAVPVGKPKRHNTRPSNGGYIGSQRKLQRGGGGLTWDDDDYGDYTNDWYDHEEDDFHPPPTRSRPAQSRRPPAKGIPGLPSTATAKRGAAKPGMHAQTTTKSRPAAAETYPETHYDEFTTTTIDAFSTTTANAFPAAAETDRQPPATAVPPTQEHLEEQYGSMIREVLGTAQFDWDTMFNSISFGISESDSFLAALESSLARAAEEALNAPPPEPTEWWAALDPYTASASGPEPDRFEPYPAPPSPQRHDARGSNTGDQERRPEPRGRASAGSAGGSGSSAQSSGFWDYDEAASKTNTPSAGWAAAKCGSDRGHACADASAESGTAGGGGHDPVDVLVAMGFDLETSLLCLADCDGDVQRAADTLLGQATGVKDPPSTAQRSEPPAKPRDHAPPRAKPLSMSESGYTLGAKPRGGGGARSMEPKVSEDDAATLQAMGFSRSAAVDALRAEGGDLMRAIEFLTG